ncbi:hypothetical protein HK102_005302 [Quaeritorhiza haematococci]|nr:hypothetical protein HK102_005302 [Quaeritorhiza haematococci]
MYERQVITFVEDMQRFYDDELDIQKQAYPFALVVTHLQIKFDRQYIDNIAIEEGTNQPLKTNNPKDARGNAKLPKSTVEADTKRQIQAGSFSNCLSYEGTVNDA